jgi:hypothetical protein
LLSLRSIAGWEEAVLASIAGAQGSAEERDRQIELSGMYGEYPAIVRAYAELFADPDSAGEAIKRAIFLVWRGSMFPPAETGIAPLPDGTVRTVIETLAVRARDTADDELGWMLAWYHSKSPDLLELYGASRELVRFAEAVPPDAWRTADISGAEWSARGQMGRYWLAKKNGAR